MIAQRRSAAIHGLDAVPVSIECEAGPGLPAFSIVGLPDGAVRESRDRVLAALRHTGFRLPPRRITINLAPSDLRKEGTSFDLPLALAVLEACEQIFPAPGHGDRVFLGELGLDGQIRSVRSAVAIAIGLREAGLTRLAVPDANVFEVSAVPGIDVVGLCHLSEAVALLETGQIPVIPPQVKRPRIEVLHPDFSDVRGQETAKRALVVAACGGHNVLMQGPPGSGKTLLARRLPGILSPLTPEEALEVTRIHSVSGLLTSAGLIEERPFRAPHHSSSLISLVGGGSWPRPGELSLAHHGVLFLDELAEYPRQILDSMRQPLEDAEVVICRARAVLRFPSRCLLVAACNPCPCGHHGDRLRMCTCSPTMLDRYRSRLSGPILDRIDLHLEIPSLPAIDLAGVGETPRGTAGMRADVMKGIAFRDRTRYGVANAKLHGVKLEEACRLGRDEASFLGQAAKRLGFSARAYARVLKVARTIADLAESERVGIGHLAEAVAYRAQDPRMERMSARATKIEMVKS